MSFITKIAQEYPDFYVIHLEDGRVIGITQECVVEYEDNQMPIGFSME